MSPGINSWCRLTHGAASEFADESYSGNVAPDAITDSFIAKPPQVQ